MFNTLNRFWNDESGPELVEWAVVTIILLVAAIVLYVAVGKALGGVVCSIYCWIAKVSQGSKLGDLKDRTTCDSKDYNSCSGKEGEGI
jgi:Flp pilus assembly pilin Flp